MESIYVTKTFLPPFDEYIEKIKAIWDTHQVTNDGPLLKEFEQSLINYTGSNYVVCAYNGTIALHIAIRALNLSGEVITTPFTHYATSGSLVWEYCTPVYADIDPETFNIDVKKVREKVTPKTTGIMAVHVFGNPCDTAALQKIADDNNLKLIYDAAHAFGVSMHGQSIMKYGDISMASFNATKALHAFEGGALFMNDRALEQQIRKLAYYGMDENRNITQKIGTNAKMIEQSAAMGILNLKYFDENVKARKKHTEQYLNHLGSATGLKFQKLLAETNYTYMPVIFESRALKQKVFEKLINNNIFPKKYFYPSLDMVFKDSIECPVSNSVAERILCLPMSNYLTNIEVDKICQLVLEA